MPIYARSLEVVRGVGQSPPDGVSSADRVAGELVQELLQSESPFGWGRALNSQQPSGVSLYRPLRLTADYAEAVRAAQAQGLPPPSPTVFCANLRHTDGSPLTLSEMREGVASLRGQVSSPLSPEEREMLRLVKRVSVVYQETGDRHEGTLMSLRAKGLVTWPPLPRFGGSSAVVLTEAGEAMVKLLPAS